MNKKLLLPWILAVVAFAQLAIWYSAPAMLHEPGRYTTTMLIMGVFLLIALVGFGLSVREAIKTPNSNPVALTMLVSLVGLVFAGYVMFRYPQNSPGLLEERKKAEEKVTAPPRDLAPTPQAGDKDKG